MLLILTLYSTVEMGTQKHEYLKFKSSCVHSTWVNWNVKNGKASKSMPTLNENKKLRTMFQDM